MLAVCSRRRHRRGPIMVFAIRSRRGARSAIHDSRAAEAISAASIPADRIPAFMVAEFKKRLAGDGDRPFKLGRLYRIDLASVQRMNADGTRRQRSMARRRDYRDFAGALDP